MASFNFSGLNMLNSSSLVESTVFPQKRISIDNIVINEDNVYPIGDITELAEDIATVGLQQNLVVKDNGDGTYMLVTGHRRFDAIKYIFTTEIDCQGNVKNDIKNPMCLILPQDEDPLVTHYKLHTTNINIRSMSDAELFTVIEDYVKTVEQIKKNHVLINGKQLSGKTRELLMEQFQMSNGTAQKVLSVVKNATPEEKKMIYKGESTIQQTYSKKTAPPFEPYPSLRKLLESKLDTPVSLKKNTLTIKFSDEEHLYKLLEKLKGVSFD